MKNRIETESEINVRAWKDPSFKKKLMTNPHAALHELGMKKIPQNIKIKIIEEDSNTWCIVLHKVPHGAESMSEEALKKTHAAGGMPDIIC